jgi:hypothetical protein
MTPDKWIDKHNMSLNIIYVAEHNICHWTVVRNDLWAERKAENFLSDNKVSRPLLRTYFSKSSVRLKSDHKLLPQVEMGVQPSWGQRSPVRFKHNSFSSCLANKSQFSVNLQSCNNWTTQHVVCTFNELLMICQSCDDAYLKSNADRTKMRESVFCLFQFFGT